MERRRLGASGLTVGELGLGCMGMSWAYTDGGWDDRESVRVIHRALDVGVTMIDTAEVYGPYTNEELVGRALRGRRDDVVLSTKVGLGFDESGKMFYDARPARIKDAIKGSLRRLDTDRVDLYFLHRVDPKVPVEESWGALAELVEEGVVRMIGLSEVTVEQAMGAHAIHPVTAIQSELSLWTRDPVAEVLPWCEENNVAFVAFAPLGRGFLTGRWLAADQMADDDSRRKTPRFSAEAVAANQVILEGLRRIADRLGVTLPQVAIAWALAQGDHVIPIPGTRRVSHLEDNLGAAAVRLARKDIEELDAIPEAVGTRF